jgi:hypothetical protein
MSWLTLATIGTFMQKNAKVESAIDRTIFFFSEAYP